MYFRVFKRKHPTSSYFAYLVCTLSTVYSIMSQTCCSLIKILESKAEVIQAQTTRELLFHSLTEQQQKSAPAPVSAKTDLIQLLILIKFIRQGERDFYTSHCTCFMVYAHGQNISQFSGKRQQENHAETQTCFRIQQIQQKNWPELILDFSKTLLWKFP